jgi:hypothetical protein
MNRSEMRRSHNAQQKKNKVFTLTQGQIDDIRKEAVKKATEKAFVLMLALPLEVLRSEEYWIKSAKKKLPKFMADVLMMYHAFEEGVITMEELEADLFEYGEIQCVSREDACE